jgi:hypothetical protein
MLAPGGWAIREASLRRQTGGGRVKLALAQRVEKIAREDQALTLPSGQILLDKMIDPTIHCGADLGAEAAAADPGILCQKLAVEPGGARRRDLRLDREI